METTSLSLSHISHRQDTRNRARNTAYSSTTFSSSMVGRTSAADMSARLAPDNVAPFVEDAVAAVVDDAAAVAAADCRSTASMDARCKAAVSLYGAVFDCTRRSTTVLTRCSEWESDYRQRDLRTASSQP